MIETKRGNGWRPNPAGNYPKARHLLGGRPMRMGATQTLRKPSLLAFRSAPLRQGAANSCTAFDLTRRLQLFFAANGMTPPDAPMIAAALDLYFKGRAEEYAGSDPDTRPALTDTGTIPYFLLRAVVNQGFALESDYPYSDDPTRIIAEPPPSLYVKSYSQRGLMWGEIDEVATARISRSVDCLIHLLPVGFGISIDEAFEQNQGERITAIDRTKLVGGHMLSLLAVLDGDMIDELRAELPRDVVVGDILFDNWWRNWGTPSGFGVMSAALYGSSYVNDVSAIEAVPPMLNRTEP